MNIGELAKRSGVSHSRIRFYEKIGLLKTADRRPNGYRTYSGDAVVMLDLIATAQNAGFSLDEIRALVPPDFANWKHGKLVATLRAKIADVEALQTKLAQSKKSLIKLLDEIEAKPAGMDCATNARRVLRQLQQGQIEKPKLRARDVRLLGDTRQRRTPKPN
ncbi:MAG: MerR family transcriptional regulator [Hyphomicrobium sp.]|uniref:MerR family transcriptional regulator n=1 Tax=Hyphomicrobium sp. TaxID=82 RepID=UPI0039E4D173